MVQAGWYPDPSGRHPHRYWDGGRWTDHVAGPNGQGVDPLQPAAPQTQQSADVQQAAQNPMATNETAQTGQVGQADQASHDAQQNQAAQPNQAAQSNQSEQPNQGAQASASGASGAPGAFHTDPAELQAVLAELGIRPLGGGDGTPFGEPMLVLAFSTDRPDALEWWTPSGRLVAVATILEKQKPGVIEALEKDPATGALIGSRIAVSGADGRQIATTVRILKPTKAPTFIDAPNGQRLAGVAQEKVFSKLVGLAITAPNGAPIGRFAATEMRAKSVVLSDNSGGPLATVVKYGKWDSGNVMMEFSRNRPFQMPTEWLATRAVSALWPIKRERICSVVIRDRPPADAFQGLLGFLAPLLLEHNLSVL